MGRERCPFWESELLGQEGAPGKRTLKGFMSPQGLRVLGFARKLERATLDSDMALNLVLCSALSEP